MRPAWIATLFLLVGCGAGARQEAGYPARDFTAANDLDRVADWALGRHNRLAPGGGRADTALVLGNTRTGARTAQLTGCARIADALPAPADSHTVFLIIDHALHALATTPDARPLPVRTEPSDLAFERLLFFEKTQPPVVVYALVRRPGAREPALWSFAVDGQRARGRPVRGDPAFRDVTEFFARFHVPRCRSDGTDCLVPASSILDVASTPGAPRRPLDVDMDAHIRVASWHPEDAESAYLVVTCQ